MNKKTNNSITITSVATGKTTLITTKTKKSKEDKTMGEVRFTEAEVRSLSGKAIFNKYGKLSNDEKVILTSDQKTVYYTWYTDEVNISHANTKLGRKIWTVDMPPIITCCKNCPCAKDCYACKGRQALCNCKGAYLRNLRLYKTHREEFVKYIQGKIQRSKVLQHFRWFSAGDIVDPEFLEFMVDTAKQFPKIRFLAYTKQYAIVNTYLDKHKKLPTNLNIVFSYWDKEWLVPNPYHLPTSYVDFYDKSRNPKLPEQAVHCPGGCETCKACWNLKPDESTIFHQH